jgi:hypothetical protein
VEDREERGVAKVWYCINCNNHLTRLSTRLGSSGQVQVKGGAQRMVLTCRIDIKSAMNNCVFVWMAKRNFCCKRWGFTR